MNPERAGGLRPPSSRTNGRANPFAAGAGSAGHGAPAAPDVAVGAVAASDTHEADRELGRRVVIARRASGRIGRRQIRLGYRKTSTVVARERRPQPRRGGASRAHAAPLDPAISGWNASERRRPHIALIAVLLCLITVSIVAIGSAGDQTADRAPRATVARMVALERANSALTRQRNAALLAERRATRRAARLTGAARRWRQRARSHRGRSESAARR